VRGLLARLAARGDPRGHNAPVQDPSRSPSFRLRARALLLACALTAASAWAGRRVLAAPAASADDGVFWLALSLCVWIVATAVLLAMSGGWSAARSAVQPGRGNLAWFLPWAVVGGWLLAHLGPSFLEFQRHWIHLDSGTRTGAAGAALHNAPAWQVALVAGGLAAIAEELFFRGAIVAALRPARPAVWIALSALLFALAHGNPERWPWTFVLGLGFGLARWWSAGILAPILMHAAYNGALLRPDLLALDADTRLDPMAAAGGMAAWLAAGAWLGRRPS